MTEMETRVIAVDWSGRVDREQEFIWVAEAVAGQIVRLENGLTRGQVVAGLNQTAIKNPDVVVGIDFAFSMPKWFVESKQVTSGPEFWEIVASEGEAWLGDCSWPFFGKYEVKAPPKELQFRQTERPGSGAKSTFQINFPGSVGVGAIRGIPHLLWLKSEGWKIWPFDLPNLSRAPLAIEIYPRLLTGKIKKNVWTERHHYLTRCYRDVDPIFIERAAGSEDAFDAAVSALVMSEHLDALRALPDLSDDPIDRFEGRIWDPKEWPT